MRTNDRLVTSLRKVSDSIDGCTIQIASVFAVLDVFACGNVGLHLLASIEKVVLAVDFAGSALTRGI